jgi:demethylmenaquinone methyltransferase/2-methoxy-6-polyprenyl-1,4-benzoquinol methylase
MTHRTESLKETSWQLFDEIAPRYDLLNRILSFGLDLRWRSQLAKFLPEGEALSLLDVATGTADVVLILQKKCPRIGSARGIDLSENMLTIGRAKIKAKGLESRIALQIGDGQELPFPDNSFDVITVAFGIRNIPDVSRVLSEMRRVLRNNGRALILEFSLPRNPVIRAGHLMYLRYIVPAIGYLFSGHYAAYRYLNQTIESFPYGREFCRIMTEGGFAGVKANPLLFGVASIYQGDKG